MATLDIVSIASDIAGAGTALAGLILVYLGAVAVRYETLDPKDQASARDVYRRHARRAFRGIVIALVAAIAALTAKALKSEPYATMIASRGRGCASPVIFHSGNGSVLDTNEPKVTRACPRSSRRAPDRTAHLHHDGWKAPYSSLFVSA